MTSAKIALLGTAAIFALGLTHCLPEPARTAGHALNKPADVRGPSKAVQDPKKAPAAPTMGQALNTPVDVGGPSKKLKDAAKKSAAAAPTMGEALHTPVDKGSPPS
jgi:hypothetical protein